MHRRPNVDAFNLQHVIVWEANEIHVSHRSVIHKDSEKVPVKVPVKFKTLRNVRQDWHEQVTLISSHLTGTSKPHVMRHGQQDMDDIYATKNNSTTCEFYVTIKMWIQKENDDNERHANQGHDLKKTDMKILNITLWMNERETCQRHTHFNDTVGDNSRSMQIQLELTTTSKETNNMTTRVKTHGADVISQIFTCPDMAWSIGSTWCEVKTHDMTTKDKHIRKN